MPCHCEQCSSDPKPTYTEAYRHQNEVDYVSQQDGEWIKEFLDGVEKKRGVAARIKLRSDVAKILKGMK